MDTNNQIQAYNKTFFNGLYLKLIRCGIAQ